MYNYFLAINSAFKLDTSTSELYSTEIGPHLGTDEWIFGVNLWLLRANAIKGTLANKKYSLKKTEQKTSQSLKISSVPRSYCYSKLR